MVTEEVCAECMVGKSSALEVSGKGSDLLERLLIGVDYRGRLMTLRLLINSGECLSPRPLYSTHGIPHRLDSYLYLLID